MQETLIGKVLTEDKKHFGHCDSTKENIVECQHGQEEIHGFMEVPVPGHHCHNQAIAYHSQEVHEAEGDGDPDLEVF